MTIEVFKNSMVFESYKFYSDTDINIIWSIDMSMYFMNLLKITLY